MGGINTYYSPGAVHTDVSGGAPMGGADTSFFYEMARRKQAQQDQERANAQEMHDLQMQAMRKSMLQPTHPQPAIQERPTEDPLARQLRQAQMNDQIMQMQAKQNPQPMKLTTVGTQTFYSPDTNAMNAYQRQAYLPNESKIVDPGTPVATGSIASVDGSAAARLRTPEEQAAHDDQMQLQKYQIDANARSRRG